MTDEKEYIIFCDESESQGRFFSNFYGGVLVAASQYEPVTRRLVEQKNRLNLYGEVKWAKVTERYLDKYVALIHEFFHELRAGHIKVRIMFTQNSMAPRHLTAEDREDGYFKLYYQFLKHAFGLSQLQTTRSGVRLRLYMDEFPETTAKKLKFKQYLLNLNDHIGGTATFFINESDIAEVRSHDHVLLQCMDIILGSMAFRLNDKHKDKPPGSYRRAKRTVAKEQLYKVIHKEICTLRPRFNVGDSTGWGTPTALWDDAYRHWRFLPSEMEFRPEKTKGNRKSPTSPTSISDA